MAGKGKEKNMGGRPKEQSSEEQRNMRIDKHARRKGEKGNRKTRSAQLKPTKREPEKKRKAERRKDIVVKEQIRHLYSPPGIPSAGLWGGVVGV